MPGALFRQRQKEREMKIEGKQNLKATRDRLWRLLIDPDVLNRCIPGCQSLEETEDGAYKMIMKAGVGSIKGLFNGSVKLDEIHELEHYRMIVEGKGSPGFLKGEGTIDLSDEGQETAVSYLGEVTVGGTLASVGQRLIQSTSKMMVGQFFAAIEAEAEAMAKAEESGEPYEPPKQGFIRNVIRQVKK
jgi:uncharacterized protein